MGGGGRGGERDTAGREAPSSTATACRIRDGGGEAGRSAPPSRRGRARWSHFSGGPSLALPVEGGGAVSIGRISAGRQVVSVNFVRGSPDPAVILITAEVAVAMAQTYDAERVRFTEPSEKVRAKLALLGFTYVAARRGVRYSFCERSARRPHPSTRQRQLRRPPGRPRLLRRRGRGRRRRLLRARHGAAVTEQPRRSRVHEARPRGHDTPPPRQEASPPRA